jgi:hypothetical protein
MQETVPRLPPDLHDNFMGRAVFLNPVPAFDEP